MASPVKRKRKTTLWLMIGGGTLLLFVLAFVVMKDQGRAQVVFTEKGEKHTLFFLSKESGTVEPVLEVKIAPDVSGEVVELNFKEGDLVKKGEMLVTIRPDNYRTAVEQANASLNQAIAGQMNAKASVSQARANFLQDSVNYFRNKALYDSRTISKLEFENAQLKYAVSQSQYEAARQNALASQYQVENSRASLRQAQQNLQRTSISAGIDGTITSISLKVGERAVGTGTMQGTEILRIADLSRMRVSVEINENDIVHIRIGDSAKVKIDAYEDKAFTGHVTEIAYSASQTFSAGTSSDQVTNFVVKVEIDPASYKSDPEIMKGLQPHQSPFRPGMSAQVEIFTEKLENVPAVPIQAVTVVKPGKKEEGSENSNGGMKEKSIKPQPENDEPREVVYVLQGSKVKAVEVKTGISDDKYISIKEGLQGGETIVTGPYSVLTQKLKDGMDVRVSKEK